MVDYRASFASTRGDSHWKRKLALGVVIALIPYLGIVWMLGWQMQYQRNIAWGYEGRIPEWSDFKGQVLLGLKGLLAVLPYSFVLSAITTPLLVASMTYFSINLASNPKAAWAAYAAGLLLWWLLLMLLTVCLMPVTGSITLRVSLYRTIDSGFQLKETWRLMKATRRDLLKAWGLSVLNMAITFGVALTLTALVAGAAWLAFASQNLIVISLVLLGLPPISILSTWRSRSTSASRVTHLFARYGRAAYELERLTTPA